MAFGSRHFFLLLSNGKKTVGNVWRRFGSTFPASKLPAGPLLSKADLHEACAKPSERRGRRQSHAIARCGKAIWSQSALPSTTAKHNHKTPQKAKIAQQHPQKQTPPQKHKQETTPNQASRKNRYKKSTSKAITYYQILLYQTLLPFPWRLLRRRPHSAIS